MFVFRDTVALILYTIMLCISFKDRSGNSSRKISQIKFSEGVLSAGQSTFIFLFVSTDDSRTRTRWIYSNILTHR